MATPLVLNPDNTHVLDGIRETQTTRRAAQRTMVQGASAISTVAPARVAGAAGTVARVGTPMGWAAAAVEGGSKAGESILNRQVLDAQDYHDHLLAGGNLADTRFNIKLFGEQTGVDVFEQKFTQTTAEKVQNVGGKLVAGFNGDGRVERTAANTALTRMAAALAAIDDPAARQTHWDNYVKRVAEVSDRKITPATLAEATEWMNTTAEKHNLNLDLSTPQQQQEQEKSRVIIIRPLSRGQTREKAIGRV